jgi:hypothetical protein
MPVEAPVTTASFPEGLAIFKLHTAHAALVASPLDSMTDQ